MTARDAVLGRVRQALRDIDPDERPHDIEVPPRVGQPGPPGADVVGLFAERVADYRAVVVRCPADRLAAAVAEALEGVSRVLVPDGFPDDLLPSAVEAVADAGLPIRELDAVDAVVTTACVGIAETGTIVLDHGPGQGRRAASLVPDRHVCVVRAEQVVAGVADAVALLDPQRPQTWISGPSATSDIELDRVEGVHGPRRLHVIVVDTPAGAGSGERSGDPQ